MSYQLRPGRLADATNCGTLCEAAFRNISEKHNFPPDFPSADVAIGLCQMLFSMPSVYSVVAEEAGRIVGSNFLWDISPVGAVGPITIDIDSQNSSLGKTLMLDVLAQAEKRGLASVRLVQAAFHNRSLALYTKLGFDVKEPLATISGAPLRRKTPGLDVRPASEADLKECDELHREIHGYSRTGELQNAIDQRTATVVERNGGVAGYSTVIGFFDHAVGRSNEEIQALIAAAPEIAGPGLLLPTRNSALFRWCLEQKLRVVQPMTLMSMGLYKEPSGSFLPSILC